MSAFAKLYAALPMQFFAPILCKSLYCFVQISDGNEFREHISSSFYSWVSWLQAFYAIFRQIYFVISQLICVHKPHLKVTALVMAVYGYYNYVGCVMYYKYVLCLCCASGLVNVKTPYGLCRMVRHTSFVSPFASGDTRHKRTSVTHVIFYLHLYLLCHVY